MIKFISDELAQHVSKLLDTLKKVHQEYISVKEYVRPCYTILYCTPSILIEGFFSYINMVAR